MCAMFGYERFGNPKLVQLMNDLYANEFSLFTNFFQPTQKLAAKKREGSKWVRKHSQPMTPAQRLIDHSDIPDAVRNKLQKQLEALNPFQLERQIQRKLKAVFKLLR